MFSTRIFMVLSLAFKSLIHLEFILVYGIRKWSSFICVYFSNIPSTIYWMDYCHPAVCCLYTFFTSFNCFLWNKSTELLISPLVLETWSPSSIFCAYNLSCLTLPFVLISEIRFLYSFSCEPVLDEWATGHILTWTYLLPTHPRGHIGTLVSRLPLFLDFHYEISSSNCWTFVYYIL